jgi:hypothetical protein
LGSRPLRWLLVVDVRFLTADLDGDLGLFLKKAKKNVVSGPGKHKCTVVVHLWLIWSQFAGGDHPPPNAKYSLTSASRRSSRLCTSSVSADSNWR